MQCVLTLNFVLEKMYIVVYLWFVMLLIVGGLSALHHTVVLFSTRYRVYTALTFMSVSLVRCQ